MRWELRVPRLVSQKIPSERNWPRCAFSRYALTDAEGASRQKTQRAGHKEEPPPVKIGQDVNCPLQQVAENLVPERRPRSPAEEKAVDTRSGGKQSAETLKKREDLWREGARGGSIRVKNCHYCAGEQVPRRRDQTRRQPSNTCCIPRLRPICAQEKARHWSYDRPMRPRMGTPGPECTG